MSPVTEADIQSASKENSVEVRKLSQKVLQKGVEAFMSLETVERSLRLDDLDDPAIVPMMTKNVVDLERHKAKLTDFIRPLAGYEYVDWPPYVAQVVTACIAQHKTTQKRLAAKAKRDAVEQQREVRLAHVG